MKKRTAKYCCPMCGSEDETRGEVYIDFDSISVDYQCNHCGIKYTISYTTQYAGFDMGEASWDENGNPLGACGEILDAEEDDV